MIGNNPTTDRKGIKRLRFGIRSLFVLTGLVGIALAVFIHIRDTAIARSTELKCLNNVMLIGIALDQYHQVYETFPPAIATSNDGTPMHSWRVLILPYLERSDLYGRYRLDEPWNSPHNLKLVSSMPECYSNPMINHPAASYCSDFLAVVGDGATWQRGRCMKKNDFGKYLRGRVLVIGVSNASRPWTEPVDLGPTEAMSQSNGRWTPNAGAHPTHRVPCVTVDCFFETIPDDIPAESIRNYIIGMRGNK